MKAKAAVSLIKPTKKFLFFFLLAYYALVGLFMFMLFVLEKEVRGVFVVTWVVALAVLGAYILYGYGRLIVLRVVEKKRAEGVIKALKTDKAFRGVFTRAGGMCANFAMVGWYLGKALTIASSFYWLLAEFFWFAAVIKLYLDYCADFADERRRYASYLVVNCLLVCLSLIVTFITLFVVRWDGVFQKSWATIFITAAFTVFKIVSASMALDKARKTKSDYHWTEATATASCAFYSLYTLVTAMIVLFSGDVAFKEASYFGFAVATLILVFAVLGIVRYSVRIDRLRKRAAAPDESAVE